MSDIDNTDRIERQYTDFPYPAPIEDILGSLERGYRQGSFPDELWPKLFPEKNYREDLNVLIAGCGTNQAIAHALKFPNSQHYAIDVSEKSLEHVANSIKKYDIKNLEFEKKDICELEGKNEFDYVVSTGVIHHTKDPQNSLSKLVEVTKQDGALFIMVYASYLRVGIYYLQDAFKYLNLKANNEGIAVAKNLIDLLPKYHYAHNYIEVINNSLGTKDLTFDAGFIDTFFNARDKAYDIFGLKDLIDKAGAYLQCWDDNAFYYRSLFNFPPNGTLEQTFNSLDPWELADFTQKMSPNNGKFGFTLRKESKYEHRFFDMLDVSPETYVSPYRLTNLEKPDFISNDGGAIGRNDVKIKLDVVERVIWDNLDNKIKDILNKSNAQLLKHGIEKELSFELLREILHRYWRNGYANFSEST